MWQSIVSPYGIILSSLIAFAPLAWLLISLGWLKISSPQACLTGLLFTAAIAMLGWGMPGGLTFRAGLEGSAYALWPIIWVIIAALFTYNICVKTGAMETIKNQIAGISADRRIQALIIAWGFGGFLEAMAGFGTAVAIPAAILIGLGFEPFFAAAICLIANTAPTAFGAVGIPVTTLAGVANVPLNSVTYDIALQLTILVILIPFLLILLVTKSLTELKGVTGATIIAGGSFAVAQLLVARYLGPQLVAVLGSVVSMTLTAIWSRLFPPSQVWRFPFERSEDRREAKAVSAEANNSKTNQYTAWLPYILLLVLILGTSNLVPAINQPLTQIKGYLNIYNGPGGHPLKIDWLVTPGTMIFIAAIIGGWAQGASLSDLIYTLIETVVNLKKTIVTIICIVAMAKIMSYSGMVSAIAVGLAQATGKVYPLFAPAIGALGTFVTGSDTSANVMFGALQKQTALQIGADPVFITAANTAGATAGKMISPQSIAIAASATGLTGKEGDLLGFTLKYCLLFILLLGALVYAFA